MAIPHIIQLLPDNLANQIAAGEVVQRPASVVKELLENAVDAGATRIDLLIKEAGKTLIQVTDNGSGMSARDARMAFERHATSKIKQESDLFNIRTLGFRGEALASIAAVAQVRVRTRLHSEELGTEIEIEANEVKKQEATVCPVGTTFLVKNLFYNVPARRNFLKSVPVETRHILQEFTRVALARPDVSFSLVHNETEVYELPASTQEARFIALAGLDLQGKLVSLEEETGYVSFHGFIARPDVNRKYRGEQYFFVNDRFIRSPFLHHAVAAAYQDFLPKETHPVYCIFLNIDPVHVDINIHPTKTEVKFDDEHTLYVLLQSLVKKGLASFHEAPSFPLDASPVNRAIYESQPQRREEQSGDTVGNWRKAPTSGSSNSISRAGWEKLYETPVSSPKDRTVTIDKGWTSPEETWLVQFSPGYILTKRGERIYIIDQQRAHQRILFERFIASLRAKPLACQQLLFPQTLNVSLTDQMALMEAEKTLQHLGFEVREIGPGAVIIHGLPPEIPASNAADILREIISDMHHTGTSDQARDKVAESIARAVAMRSAVGHQQRIPHAEAQSIASDLFRCDNPASAPNGKPTYRMIDPVELEDYFR